jgi:hypothetical protein
MRISWEYHGDLMGIKASDIMGKILWGYNSIFSRFHGKKYGICYGRFFWSGKHPPAWPLSREHHSLHHWIHPRRAIISEKPKSRKAVLGGKKGSLGGGLKLPQKKYIYIYIDIYIY